MLVIAHRVSDQDLSSHLLQEKGWTYLRLSLIAVKTRDYELGHEVWTRKKGELLRPKAYPKAELERLRPALKLLHHLSCFTCRAWAHRPR